ncbi:arylsulfotransferase family protein [Streptomyces sp. NPDC000134]|uniref:arylsulfotransferase family protein n=1 Tax=Streptomyces sp. NPDC000134 TaxID=3364536 RepID=UPI00369C4CA5
MTYRSHTLTVLATTALLAVASTSSRTVPDARATPVVISSPIVSEAAAGALQPGDLAGTGVTEPPAPDIQVRRPGLARGDLFIAPQALTDDPRGPQIIDDHGRPIWFRELPTTAFATNFRVQEYRGEKVLTWWEGEATNTGKGNGIGYIANENYEIIATVQTPDTGEVLDLHEFLLTPQGTALVISYQEKPLDLSSVGGDKDGTVLDSVVQEIDIATGKKLLDWSASEHVPLTDSDSRARVGAPMAFDFLHVNSVGIDTDGNLLISGYAASTVYKVDRHTGEIIWRLGGRNSDFRLGVGARFNWQHDVRAVGANTYRIFDNATFNGLKGYESRVAWIKIDPKRGTASLVRQLTHPDLMSTLREGGAESLPNGNTLVNWAAATPGRISEFSPDGKLLFDATFPFDETSSSYRAYRLDWDGKPLTKPKLLTEDVADGKVRANWNGATDVSRWRLLAGGASGSLKPVATAAWDGFDTPITVPARARDADRLQVQALDARGKVIGTSAVTPAGADQDG